MNYSGDTDDTKLIPILTSDTYITAMVVLLVPLFAVSLLGVVTNAINVMVFLKQGVMSDSTTLSLFSLTVADFMGCVFILPHSICFYLNTFVVSEFVLVKNCLVFSTMTATYPHILCSQITCWITVYISVQRALCVLFPLHVKLWIKKKVTLLIIMFIVSGEIFLHIPFMANNPIIWIPEAGNNNSVIAINYLTPTGLKILEVITFMEYNILTTVAMLIVTMATLIIVIRMKSSMTWRDKLKKTTKSPLSELSKSPDTKHEQLGDNKSKSMTTKDKEAVKVVTSVALLFLTCLAFSHLPAMASYVVPEFYLNGLNRDMFQLFFTFKFNLDVLNASLAFFFYIKQSSKYRKNFYALVKDTLNNTIN